MEIGEIAPATAGHQDLLANFIGPLKHNNTTTPPAGRNCAHQAGGATAKNYNVKFVHVYSQCPVRSMHNIRFDPEAAAFVGGPAGTLAADERQK